MMGDEKGLPLPNGSGAAAVLAAGIGSLLVAVFAILADQISSVKKMMVFYKPTGPLSGVTTCAVVIWLVVWVVLDRRWRTRDVALGRIVTVAVTLLGLSVLLTFPPVADLF
jgi:D-alanyl-lipoteichoic acid acyltransferase DltB (MBOAT superfamily)